MATKKQSVTKKVSSVQTAPTMLLQYLRLMIEQTRQGVAVAVNAALTLLYWRVGRRINEEILKEKRPGYEEQILATVSQELQSEYGWEWGIQDLRYCLYTAETFPEKQIVPELIKQLSRTHFLIAEFCTTEILRRDIPHRCLSGLLIPSKKRMWSHAKSQGRQGRNRERYTGWLCIKKRNRQ